MKLRTISLLLVSLITFTLLAQTPVVVTLDSVTFATNELPALTQYASLSTAAINAMIPGVPSGYAQPSVTVFNESPEFQKANHITVPITLVGPKLPGEPASTKAGTIRIGVIGIGGPDVPRFVFQLAHELTHVKMGASVSNTLVEALASSASHEVLVRMGFADYLVATISPEVARLPPEVQRAYAASDFAALRPYWQSRCAAHWNNTGDIGCQVLGSYVLKAHQPPGSMLLNISRYTVPLPSSMGFGTQVRPPDVAALKRAGFPVEALGY